MRVWLLLSLLCTVCLPVLSISSVESTCKWRFQGCSFGHERIGNSRDSITARCVVVFKSSCSSSSKINDSNYIVTHYCTEACDVRPGWCTWAEWTKSTFRCGEESGVRTRIRRKSCHPVTLKPLTTILHAETDVDVKRVPWTKCEEANSLDFIYPHLWGLAIFTGIAIIVISVVVFLCRRHRRRSRLVRRQEPSAPPRQASAEFLGSQAPPTKTTGDLPPSYTLCTRSPHDSLPPQYEDALKLVS